MQAYIKTSGPRSLYLFPIIAPNDICTNRS
jgi:hypothetical protein